MGAHAFRPKADLRSMPAMTAIIALRLLANENRRDLVGSCSTCVERQFENARVAVEQIWTVERVESQGCTRRGGRAIVGLESLERVVAVSV